MKYSISALLAASTLIGCANAQDWKPDRLVVPLGSYHVGAEPDQFNQFNPGAILEWNLTDSGRLRAGGGAFLNSFNEIAPIIEVSGDFFCKDKFCLGGMIGTTIYDSKVYPAGNLNASYGPVWVGYSHAWGLLEDTSGVVQFGLKAEF